MNEENRILRIVYTFFLGLLISIFVGVGINAFYAPPPEPIYPNELNSLTKEPTSSEIEIQNQYIIIRSQFDEKMKPYNRNVSMITLGIAVLLLIVSLAYDKKIKIIADGLMLGGLFLLIYSIGRGFASENNKYVFALVSIGLIAVLYLGFHRFVKERVPKD